MIQFANPLLENISLREKINQAINSTITSGTYINGEQVSRFEQNFANFITSKLLIGCASGTDALVLSLKNSGVMPGDEVIVPSHTASPTISAIRQVSAQPVFCDIEEDYYTIDFDHAASLVSKNTRALVAVHLYGGCCDIKKMNEFKENFKKIAIIEDCAQAIGTEYESQHVGSFQDYGAFSFFPTKNLGAIGDAGAVSCKTEDQELNIRQLAQYGWDKSRRVKIDGFNSRLDELQAAILNVKLTALKNNIIERQKIAKIYGNELSQYFDCLPLVRKKSNHSYHLYVVQTNQRDKCINFLRKAGINCGIHYKTPSHLMPAYKNCKASSLEVTEKISSKILSLPMYPGLSEKKISYIIDEVKFFFKNQLYNTTTKVKK